MTTVKFKGKDYKVKFIHKRFYLGYYMASKKDSHEYKPQLLEKGGLTIAFIEIPKPTGDVEDDFIPIHAKAECSIKDNYNKKIGRTIALGRLIKKLKEME